MTFSYSSSDEQRSTKSTLMKLSSTRLQKPVNTLWKTWETETNIELGTVKEHMKVLCTLSRKWYSGKQPRLDIIETAHKTKTHKWSTRLYESEPQLYFTSTNPSSPSQIICFFLSLSLSHPGIEVNLLWNANQAQSLQETACNSHRTPALA